ncbi:MAG TPA: hypothetical protein VJ779_08805 [Acetobacteraceae bacterium]|nr:hypothetical protein [Acetobacteraceae bacterium]
MQGTRTTAVGHEPLRGRIFVAVGAVMAQPPIRTPPNDAACSGGTVVWLSTRSHTEHCLGEQYVGAPKHGKFPPT